MKKLLVLIAAALFVAGSVMPVMAQDKAEWSFYGSARMWTEYRMLDKEVTTSTVVSNPLAGIDDEEELIWDLQGNSRFGAIAKYGDIGGQVEYGTGVNLRLLYGTWNFGPGTFLVGQDYTPNTWAISGQCGLGGGDCGLGNWGDLYGGRQPQLKLIMGNFQFALIKPNASQLFTAGGGETTTVTVPSGATPPAGGVLIADDGVTAIYAVASETEDFSKIDTDFVLPKIEASYVFNLGAHALWFGAGYNTVDLQGIENETGLLREQGLDSWFVGIGAKTISGLSMPTANSATSRTQGLLLFFRTTTSTMQRLSAAILRIPTA
jgi:hypothetical protein